MPIEIKELHIKVTVNATPQPGQQTATPAKTEGVEGGHDDRDAIVAECVEQVLNILQHKVER